MSTSAHPLSLMQSTANAWRDVLAKSVLFFFGIALWYKGLSFYAYYLLPFAWVLDGGIRRFGETVREPLVIGILLLCFVLALGILWSDYPKLGFRTWRRYAAFLVFIPYLGLLNKERLFWAVCGLLIGYFAVLATGIYYWLILKQQGIPPLGMTYIHFSSMLGIGVITTLYLASASIMEKRKLFFAFLSAMLLLIQFQQHARGVLGATIISTVFLIFLLYRKQARRLLGLMTLLTVVIALFTYHSERLQERLVEARNDIAMSKMGSHSTSLGYRFALWDIGLQGIAKRPLVGYGTGMAVSYFDKNIDTYKNGLYKNLRKLHSLPLHYHNDWIEIGMHLGILGVLVYGYFLRSWYQTLSRNQAGVLGAVLLCFILLSGLTDVPVFLRQDIYLLVVITAVGVVSSKINGMESVTQKRIN